MHVSYNNNWKILCYLQIQLSHKEESSFCGTVYQLGFDTFQGRKVHWYQVTLGPPHGHETVTHIPFASQPIFY